MDEGYMSISNRVPLKLSSIILVLKTIPLVRKMECLFDDNTYRMHLPNHDFRLIIYLLIIVPNKCTNPAPLLNCLQN
jgi:uncharacterized membrane protein YwaF